MAFPAMTISNIFLLIVSQAGFTPFPRTDVSPETGQFLNYGGLLR